MDLTPTQLGGLAVTGLVLAIVALALATWSQLRLRTLRRSYRVLWAGGERDVATLVGDQHRRLDRLEGEVAVGRVEVAAVRGDVARSLRHVAVVRYDAFGDMGGRLSFSCAVIDDEGDGLVLSAIHARGESRTYAKGIVGGTSTVTLSPEEQQALSSARADEGRGAGSDRG
ncbi:DUF4446 family protein [Lapillicoccus sp.]|uniref:DUF4446 family protein n=1 Tax=Lapillicoccus sp. TaxID=1909287 RepID=UPI0025D0059C|nr:DUF4446 family protein [Lapillicoccus sp.]